MSTHEYHRRTRRLGLLIGAALVAITIAGLAASKAQALTLGLHHRTHPDSERVGERAQPGPHQRRCARRLHVAGLAGRVRARTWREVGDPGRNRPGHDLHVGRSILGRGWVAAHQHRQERQGSHDRADSGVGRHSHWRIALPDRTLRPASVDVPGGVAYAPELQERGRHHGSVSVREREVDRNAVSHSVGRRVARSGRQPAGPRTSAPALLPGASRTAVGSPSDVRASRVAPSQSARAQGTDRRRADRAAVRVLARARRLAADHDAPAGSSPRDDRAAGAVRHRAHVGSGGVARARDARAGGRGVDAGRRRPVAKRLVRQRQPHSRAPSAGRSRDDVLRQDARGVPRAQRRRREPVDARPVGSPASRSRSPRPSARC